MSQHRRRLRRRDEAGYAAVLVALLASAVFMGVAAMGVDTARWYVEAEKVQKAADAAALAGVTYMPNDLDGARDAAERVAELNGFDVDSAQVEMTVQVGDRPSELEVVLSSTISNTFGGYLGMDETTITRSAVADFTAPAPMGSPCNTFGNEPPSQPAPAAQPAGSALPATPFPNCNSQPFFWAAIEGPTTDKVEGDRFMNYKCTSSSTYRCENVGADRNDEYRSEGYYWAVHVEPEAKDTPISVQIYDPAYMNTGVSCTNSTLPRPTSLFAHMNSYTQNDGTNRYSATAWGSTAAETNPNAVKYCSGDYPPSSTTGGPPVTTFVLRDANETKNPRIAAPITGCTKQFVGATAPPTVTELSQWTNMTTRSGNNTNFNPQKAQIYHQWVPLCTFTPGKAGDFYLQVRTNVSTTNGDPVLNRNAAGSTKSTLIYENNEDAWDLDGNLTTGGGLNSFSMRAVPADTSKRPYIAVAGNESMPILQNKSASTATFNLIRALPNTRGQYIAFDFYDPADGAGSAGATVKIVAPTDATGSIKATSNIPNCSHAKNDVTTYTAASNCTVTVKNTTHNGQLEHMLIPIPNDYNCNPATLGGCWFSVAITFPDTVTDFTTWTANITGDPVRLIE